MMYEDELGKYSSKYSEILGSESRLIIIGGSYNVHFPVVLVGRSLIEWGCDEIHIFVPSKIINPIRSSLPTFVIPLPDQKITRGGARRVLRYLEKIDGVNGAYLGLALSGIWIEACDLAYRLCMDHNLKVVIDDARIMEEGEAYMRNIREIYGVLEDFEPPRYIKEYCFIIIGDRLRIVSSSGLVEEFKIDFRLKYFDKYILASLYLLLISKGIPAIDAAKIALYTYISSVNRLRSIHGSIYSYIDVINSIKGLLHNLAGFDAPPSK